MEIGKNIFNTLFNLSGWFLIYSGPVLDDKRAKAAFKVWEWRPDIPASHARGSESSGGQVP